MPSRESLQCERVIGRYALYGVLAAGGMATVHFGRLQGPVGFARTVAIKRLHPQFARDPEFVSMFLDEARVAARIQHPNVVPTLDVVAMEGELFLVMEYVQGEALARLIRKSRDTGRLIPPKVVASIMTGVLYGLHAAHEARSERGEELCIVHRDVSPQNVLVGADGIARVLDFGVAKAVGRVQTTRDGQIKGKIAYMPPEQLGGVAMDRRTDVYAASVVLWEALTSRRLFDGENEAIVFGKVLNGIVEPPSKHAPGITPELDAIVLRGLQKNPDERWATAREMADAIEDAVGLASPRKVSEWIQALVGESLKKRAARIKEIESESTSSTPPPAAQALIARLSLADESSETSGAALISMGAAATPIPEASGTLSKVSSVSYPANDRPSMAPRQRRRTGVIISLVALLLGGASAFLIFGRPLGSAEGERAPATSPSDDESFLAEPESSPAESASNQARPAVTAPSHASASASAAPAATASPVTVPPPIQPPPTTQRPPPPPPVPTVSCNPPYTVDSDGIRHIKPACLK